MASILTIAFDASGSPSRGFVPHVTARTDSAGELPGEGCFVVDNMPLDVRAGVETEWWVCPDAQLEQKVCREVYLDDELTVACAY